MINKYSKKTKSTPRIIGAGFIIILIVIAIFGIYFGIAISLTPNFEGIKEFTISQGQTFDEITTNLTQENLIQSKTIFELYLLLRGQRSQIQAGTYQFEPLNIIKLANKLVTGEAANEITIKLIEGWTVDEMATYLGEQKIAGCSLCSKENFLTAAQVSKFKGNYDFLANLSTESLEGFIFPDTYRIFKDATPHQVIERALTNFSEKITPALQTEITAQGKNLYDVLIMASMIEQEVPHEEDRKIVAGILWKRLNDGMLLQVDSSLKYKIGKKDSNTLTFAELEIDSPYNTYKYKGFPPTPICNPGESAIRAAIYPKDSDYWFYLSDKQGNTIFSKTGEEHEANVEKYLRR